VRSLPVQLAYILGLILPAASAESCSSTARASPAIGTSTGRLWPSSAGLTSTWMTFMSAAKRGGRPNWIIQSKREPTARTQSVSVNALLRAFRNDSAWSSGMRPREMGLVQNGMPVASTNTRSAAAPSDHHTPLPATMIGRCARARSAIASLIAPVSPSVRGDGFHAGA